MKALILTVLLVSSLGLRAQERVDLHLEMASSELERSADCSDAAIYCALIGGAMTAIASGGKERDAWIVGGITVATTYTLVLRSNGHKRRAAFHLRHQ